MESSGDNYSCTGAHPIYQTSHHSVEAAIRLTDAVRTARLKGNRVGKVGLSGEQVNQVNQDTSQHSTCCISDHKRRFLHHQRVTSFSARQNYTYCTTLVLKRRFFGMGSEYWQFAATIQHAKRKLLAVAIETIKVSR